MAQPELDIALQWKQQSEPNAVWAGQINHSFDDAMRFLALSEQKALQEAQDKEKEQRSRLKRARSFATIIGVIAFVSILLMIYAFNQQKEANQQKQEATNQKLKAEKSALIAFTNERYADSMKKKADTAYVAANQKAEEAKRAAELARAQTKRADSLANVAQKALKRSENSKAEALEAQQRVMESQQQTYEMLEIAIKAADQQKKSAKEAERSSKTADSLAAMADSRQYAIKAMEELAAGNKTNAKFFADTAYRLNANNHGPVQTSYIFNALHQYWAQSIQQQNEVQTSKEPATSVVALSNNKVVVANKNGTIGIFTFTGNKLSALSTQKFKGDVVGMASSPDEKQLAVITGNGKGTLFNIAPNGNLSSPRPFRFEGTGTCVVFASNLSFAVLSNVGISLFAVENSARAKGLAKGSYTAIAARHTGVLYATNAQSVNVFDNEASLLANKPSAIANLSFGFIEKSNAITCLAVTDSGNYIAAGTQNGKIQILHKENGIWQRLPLLWYHQGAITAVAFAYISGNRLQLASAGFDETVKLIDVRSFATTAPSHLSKTTTHTMKEYLRLQNSDEIVTLQGHGKSVCSLAYSKDGSLLFSGGNDGKLMAWKPAMSDLFNSVMWDVQAQAAE